MDQEERKLGTSKITPIGPGCYDWKKDIRLTSGPNTIFKKDEIPIEESLLNNMYLIKDELGIHKKIYLRNDKFDLIKPAEDVLEARIR